MIHLTGKGKYKFIRVLLIASLVLTGSSLSATQTLNNAATSHVLFGFKQPANFNWAGPYIGAYLGGAWSNASLTTNAGSVTTSSYFSSSTDITSVNQNGTNSLYPTSPIVGMQLGDNFILSPRVIVGLVLDYGSFHLSETNSANNITYPSGSGNYSVQTSINTNWLYTIRGRIGLLPPTSWPVMVYATGGLAVTNLEVSNHFTDSSSLLGVGTGSGSNNQTGWTVGAGLDVPLTDHLTINAEYLYLSFGNVNANSMIQNSTGGFGVPANSLTSAFTTSANLNANLFKIGLNYKF